MAAAFLFQKGWFQIVVQAAKTLFPRCEVIGHWLFLRPFLQVRMLIIEKKQ
jgi:hypothetical protein